MESRLKTQLSKIIQSTLNSCSCRPKHNSDVSDHRQNPNPRRLIDLFSPKPQPLPFPAKNPQPAHEKSSKTDRTTKKLNSRRRRNCATFSSGTDNHYYNWWSSEEDTLFSRRSASSDSFESIRRNRGRRNGNGNGNRKGFVCRDMKGEDAADGVAVVAKDSSDPYEDFRVSMVDMIVEKGLFGVEELENMVECFLSLNDEQHHKVIVDVFAEIWGTLITDY